MAYKLETNPLDANPLFRQPEQDEKPSAAKKESAKKQPKKSAAKPAPAPKKRAAKTESGKPAQPAKPVQTAPPEPVKADPDAFVRATFIMRKDLLKRLKDYAYTERREIKDVVNALLENALLDVEREYQAAGKIILEKDER